MSAEIVVCIGFAPRQVLERSLGSSEAITVEQTMAEIAGWQLPDGTALGLQIGAFRPSVWGKPVSMRTLLKAGDRLELVRGLRVDPKVARRERFAQQGARSAGLFSKKRPNAKPGY